MYQRLTKTPVVRNNEFKVTWFNCRVIFHPLWQNLPLVSFDNPFASGGGFITVQGLNGGITIIIAMQLLHALC